MGLMSKEAENPVLFERAEILDNLDQRFVSVKGRLPKEEAGGVEMLLLNGNVLDAFAQFIDRMIAVIAISVRRLFHRHSHLKDKASV